jgi:hypothetical protein
MQTSSLPKLLFATLALSLMVEVPSAQGFESGMIVAQAGRALVPPSAESPTGTATVRFQVYPKSLAVGGVIEPRLIDASTDLALQTGTLPSVHPSKMDQQLGLQTVVLNSSKIDHRDVYLFLNSLGSVGLGAPRSENFSLAEGPSPLLQVRFPEVGILEIEIPDEIKHHSAAVPIDFSNGLVVQFLKLPSAASNSESGAAYVQTLFDRNPCQLRGPRDFELVVQNRLPNSFGARAESVDSTFYYPGFLSTGQWQVSLRTCDAAWASIPQTVQIEANRLSRIKLMQLVQMVPIPLDFQNINPSQETNFRYWAKREPFFFRRLNANYRGNYPVERFLAIPAGSTELLIAGGWMDPGDPSIAKVYLSTYAGFGPNQTFPEKIACWPKSTQQPDIILPPVSSNRTDWLDSSVSDKLSDSNVPFSCFLQIREQAIDGEFSTNFPLEGISLMMSDSQCQIYGLPVGRYQISRISDDFPSLLIDQATVTIHP